MPEPALAELLPAASSWLQKRRTILANVPPGGTDFLALWDRFADLAYPADSAPANNDDSLLDQALTEPAGNLAWTFLDYVVESRPKPGAGLSPVQSNRLTRAVRATGRPGLLARLILGRSLAYLDSIDHSWASAQLIPYLAWDQPQAATMWRSRASDHPGTAQLFNSLKTAMLEAFEKPVMSDHDLEGLMAQMLTLAFAHKRQEANEYILSGAEIKRALSSGPDGLRGNTAWRLWRVMGDANGEPTDKAVRWRQHVGPLFQEIWPLDATLRSVGVSRNLVLMSLECGDAFAEAVDAVIDIIVPYQLYLIAHSFSLEPAHDALVRKYARAALELANALIDPAAYPVPSDLAEFLQTCLDADPGITSEPSYIRLFGLRRQSAA
jgi:hypothetical protein